ncbi:MAG: DUF1801 domain-containing protein [Candidatus Lokiarchaeota archaeon]|nr:DUF1801 domain-containing protein [Candidatus Lokiarchaeota archaeon]
MAAPKKTYRTIDEYLADFSSPTREILEKIRATIKNAAPEAEEAMAYQIPTFKLGKNLVHFAAFKHHIGFYPTPSGIERFKHEFSQYDTAKGSVRFPLDAPIPYDLIEKVVEYRVKAVRGD